jgi:anti-sigma factor RsiW
MIDTLKGAHFPEEQLNAFVDGELSAVEIRAMDAHVAGCHACALRVLTATRLKAVTASAGRRITAPPEALARLTAQLRQQEPAKKKAKIYAFPAARWGALAACLLIAVSVVGLKANQQASQETAELLDQHLAAISSGAAPDVISEDRHTVKPWFQGKLPFSFNLPETLPAETKLTGGDMAYVGGRPAAMLLFTVHKHEVSVFLTQRAGGVSLPKLSGTRSGFSVRYATTSELNIAGVSDLNPVELGDLVAVLAKVQ